MNISDKNSNNTLLGGIATIFMKLFMIYELVNEFSTVVGYGNDVIKKIEFTIDSTYQLQDPGLIPIYLLK